MTPQEQEMYYLTKRVIKAENKIQFLEAADEDHEARLKIIEKDVEELKGARKVQKGLNKQYTENLPKEGAHIHSVPTPVSTSSATSLWGRIFGKRGIDE